MIGLDTNVLVRYFAQDDPVQSARAVELIEGRLHEDDPGFVSIVAMVEMVWVLERSYGLGEQELAAIIERLLQAPVLVIESEVEVFTALTALKEGHGDFADVVLVELGRRAGCSVTFTFDRKAARLPRVALA
jgi:predicted nucleic-acid-binding protein